METRITLTTFTPAEAEAITGISTALQRDWRRRGIFPKTDGHARFDVFGLAKMLAMKMLSDRGVGPVHTADEAEWCAMGIVWHALAWIDAWEGEPEKALTWFNAFAQPPAVDPVILASIEKANENGHDMPVPEVGSHWGSQSEFLRRKVLASADRPRIVPANIFIWWADGSHIFHNSVDVILSEMTSDDPRITGPVIFLDMRALASTLLDRAGRALAHVEFEKGDGIEFGEPVPLDPRQFASKPE